MSHARLTVAIVAVFFLVPPLANASIVVPASGLIGYWTGNGTADDSSSLHNNGTFTGSYAPGNPAGGDAFNLATGVVTIPDIPAYTFNNYPGWSVGFWFNTNGAVLDNNNGTFLGQDNGSGCSSKWFIDYDYNPGPSQSYILHFNNPGCAGEAFLSSNVEPNPDNGWHQLTTAFTNGMGISFYLDGNPIGTASYTGPVPDPTADLTFGREEPCCNYEGLLADVVIYDRVLSLPEVRCLAGLCSVPEPASLSLLWVSLAGFGIACRHRTKAN